MATTTTRSSVAAGDEVRRRFQENPVRTERLGAPAPPSTDLIALHLQRPASPPEGKAHALARPVGGGTRTRDGEAQRRQGRRARRRLPECFRSLRHETGSIRKVDDGRCGAGTQSSLTPSPGGRIIIEARQKLPKKFTMFAVSPTTHVEVQLFGPRSLIIPVTDCRRPESSTAAPPGRARRAGPARPIALPEIEY